MTTWGPPPIYTDYMHRWKPARRSSWGLIFLLAAILATLLVARRVRGQDAHQAAIIMIPATLSPSGEPLGFEGTCEPSRVYAPALECRATAKGE